ncbi:MAG: hypothetical protein JO138_18430 [Acidobacteriaceae bacterium]|nr:hypothetical protein [Acidobacteriaceae bacterium]
MLAPLRLLALLPFGPAVDAIRVDNCTDPRGNKITTDQRGIKPPARTGVRYRRIRTGRSTGLLSHGVVDPGKVQ